MNCGSVGGDEIHVALGPSGATEYEGIVAEMISQLPRLPGWDAATLNTLHTDNVQVLVIGGLTYDNEHLANADPRRHEGWAAEAFVVVGKSTPQWRSSSACGLAAVMRTQTKIKPSAAR